MELSDKTIKEFKNIYKKEYNKDISDKDARESAHNLVHFVELLRDQAILDYKRTEKLKENPKGFHLEGIGYTCFICRDSISNEETWYDKWGIKCLTCQKAIDKKIIPASVAKNENSWYSKYDLESRFNIDRHAMNKLIKAEILIPRIVPNHLGGAHVHLFLIKDNEDILPPKELTQSQLVKEVGEDGKEWFHSEPWYKFVDPFKHLEGYKIMNYLRLKEYDKTKK
ncbi:MAG: hypothetical protein ACKKL6_00590 [Candidatus Komeilibacteria bacterium]